MSDIFLGNHVQKISEFVPPVSNRSPDISNFYTDMLYTPGHDPRRPVFLSNGRYSFPPHHMTDADRLYFSRQDTPRYEYVFGKPVGFLQNRISGIRTHGLCVPNAALYQTEPQSDMPPYLTTNDIIVQRMCTNIFLGKYARLFKIFLTLFC